MRKLELSAALCPRKTVILSPALPFRYANAEAGGVGITLNL